MRLLSLLLAACALLAGTAHAQADLERERRTAEEVRQNLLVGEALSLQLPSGRSFFAILTRAAKPRAGVVLVHGIGAHPDWGLINALRTQLPAAGYTTLSIQMPVLAEDAKPDQYPTVYPDAGARLRAAVAFLRASGLEKVVVISHDVGGNMVNDYLVRDAQPAVNAWVSIGIAGGAFRDAAKLRLPVLDVFGEKDFAVVLKGADARANDIRLLRGSAQVEVAGADHFFDGHAAALAGHVRLWLDRALK